MGGGGIFSGDRETHMHPMYLASNKVTLKLIHGCVGVHRTCVEKAAVSRYTSYVKTNQRCNLKNALCKATVTRFRVTYHQSAVGLVGSREQRYSCHCEALKAHADVPESSYNNNVFQIPACILLNDPVLFVFHIISYFIQRSVCYMIHKRKL